jgi:dephospho-CoA kinase
MTRVALTGGIATGKSTVLRRIAAAGLPTIDADDLARSALAPGSAAVRHVAARFGAGVVDPATNIVDREALGRVVFADAAARADLEAIVHPLVYQAIERWFDGLPASTAAAVADIPLLFETRREHDFDMVVVTTCTEEEQVRRLRARDGLSEADARARIEAQWPTSEKAARADVVIRTDARGEETDRQVDALVARLRDAGRE